MNASRWVMVCGLCLAFVGCGSDDGEPTPTGVDVFRFGATPGQALTDGPFPHDALIGSDGKVQVAIASDARLSVISSKPELMSRLDELAATRTGFGSIAPVWFFAEQPMDLTSFEGQVELVAVGGRDAGRTIAARVFENTRLGAIGVAPVWGEYLVPESTYAVLIKHGVRTAAGEVAGAPAGFVSALTDHAAWAGVRTWAQEAGRSTSEWVVGTVFTTQAVLPLGRALLDAVDDYALQPVSSVYRYDPETDTPIEATPVEEDGMAAFFGTPVAPYEDNPGGWGSFSRSMAGQLDGTPYEGGLRHADFGRLVFGSIRIPVFNMTAQGDKAVATPLSDPVSQRLEALAPFTLVLCDSHLDDPSNLPVAIFNHGGGATRIDVMPVANANCRVGVATVAIDMLFHGGRRKLKVVDGDLVVPVEADEVNAHLGQPGQDFVGDPAGSAESVAPLFALNAGLDPGLIEGHLLTVSADTYALVRYLKEGDWSAVMPGLSFDASRLFHTSLSFGTSFTTPLLALRDDFAAVVGSVGSGSILPTNMLMAPSNAAQAAGVYFVVTGTPTSPEELQGGSWKDFYNSLHAWLHERGDPMPWATHVLRHRDGGTLPAIVSSGNSWDETLFNPAQISYSQAMGLEPFTAGADWTIDPTIDGASFVTTADAPEGGVAGNVTFGGQTTTAAIFYQARACHGQLLTPVCGDSYEHPYPPIRALDEPVAHPSVICGLHDQLREFFGSALAGDEHPRVIPPTADCATVYGN